MDQVYSSQFVVFLVEMLLVLYRRSMIVSLRSQTSVMIAIVATGLEEAILRLSLRERDMIFRRLANLSPQSEEERKRQEKLLAISIVHSTMTEILACLISRLSFVMLKRKYFKVLALNLASFTQSALETKDHRFVFNMGDIAQTDSMLMINLCFELVGEAFVDVLCLYTEKKRGIPVSYIFQVLENGRHLLVRSLPC